MSRIRELRHNKGMSQAQLAAVLHVHQTAVSQWEQGRTMPDVLLLTRMAEYFNVSIDYLLGSDQPSKGVRIPVLGRVPAGIPIEAIQDILGYEEITEEMALQGEFFALQIKGASMEPRIREGDVVIIRKQEDVENGDIALVLVNGEDATVKRFYQTEQGVKLIPLNPVYEPLFYTAYEVAYLPVTVIGKVVELRGKL